MNRRLGVTLVSFSLRYKTIVHHYNVTVLSQLNNMILGTLLKNDCNDLSVVQPIVIINSYDDSDNCL